MPEQRLSYSVTGDRANQPQRNWDEGACILARGGSSEALDLFEPLARACPTIEEAQVDAVLRTLRDLITKALAAQRDSDPTTPAAFRLAAEPPS